jgi:phospholipid/cholesterol/gamma-HCH transport system substrate-binding protein
MLPYLNDLSGALMNLDTGQVFTNMLAAVPEDGAITLHVTIPPANEPATPDAPHPG